MNIGIAGAGILGRMLAFACLKAGHCVSLFDQDDAAGEKSCSMAAAGLLAPMTELEKSPPLIYQLGMDALQQYWPDLLSQINNDIYFRRMGSVVLAHPKEQAELKQFVKKVENKYNIAFSPASSRGLSAGSRRCVLDPADKPRDDVLLIVGEKAMLPLNQLALYQLEPELTHFSEAYYFPNEGQIDNQSLLKSLQQALNERKVIWHTKTRIVEMSPNTITTSVKHNFDLVADCRGLGAKATFSDLYGVRGELIWLHAPEVTIKRPIRFLHPRYSLYIVPRPQHNYLVGASEIETEDESAISVRSTLELLTAAYCIHPGFSEARMIKTITHCRPTFPNHLPKINYKEGWLAVNGLYRHGFLIAPTLIADIMRWLATGQRSSLHYPQLWELQ